MTLEEFCQHFSRNYPIISSGTEEDCKNILISPFLNSVGIACNSSCMRYEQRGARYAGNNSDYNGNMDYTYNPEFDDNGKVRTCTLIIEAKSIKALNTNTYSSFYKQLNDYFNSVYTIKYNDDNDYMPVVILTNGAQWFLYHDIIENNKLDTEPFFTIDFTSDWVLPTEIMDLFEAIANNDYNRIDKLCERLKKLAAVKGIIEKYGIHDLIDIRNDAVNEINSLEGLDYDDLSDYVTSETKISIVDDEDEKQLQSTGKQRSITLDMIGIKNGDNLTLKDNPFVTATVIDCTSRRYTIECNANGKSYTGSLSKIAGDILDRHPLNGNNYWTYNGKTISEWREELEI